MKFHTYESICLCLVGNGKQKVDPSPQIVMPTKALALMNLVFQKNQSVVIC